MNLGERGLFIHFSSVKSHITHKKKKKKRREINWSKKFGRQYTKTHKKKKFSTRFFVVRKNVQMNKKYVLKKFHKVGKGGKKWWWWWW